MIYRKDAFMRIRTMCPVIAASLMLASTIVLRADRLTFPVVVSRNGITVTITDAYWMDIGKGQGLLAHYKVDADNSVPFEIGPRCTRILIEDPAGNGSDTQAYEDHGIFGQTVSPSWNSARLHFHIVAPNAPSDYDVQKLTWTGVPVPTTRDIPVNVGASQTTKYGSVVTLEKVDIRSTDPDRKSGPNTLIVFRMVADPGFPDCKPIFQGQLWLTDPSGVPLGRNPQAWYSESDWLTGAAGFLSLGLQYPADQTHAGTMNVSLSVAERSESLRDPRLFRDVDVDIPLSSLPGSQSGGDTPDTSLAHATVGPLSATLESITRDKAGLWHMKFWLKSPLDGPQYQLCQYKAVTDTGVNLDTYLPCSWSEPQTPWKSNGAAPAPGEAASSYVFKPIAPFPPDARSITVTATAHAYSSHLRHFSFMRIPVPARASSVDVNAIVRDPSERDRPDSPVTVKILRLRTYANSRHGTDSNLKADKLLEISCEVSGIPYKTDGVALIPRRITDNMGRLVNIKTTFCNGKGPFVDDIVMPAPGSDVTSLNIEMEEGDSVQNGPPIEFTFANLPLPSWLAESAPEQAP